MHRANLLCLVARALAVDEAANDPFLAALVLSVLPPRSTTAMAALQPRAGVTAQDVHALCEAFATVFCILPARTAGPAHIPGPGDATPLLRDAVRDAAFRAASRKNGDAEELSTLFTALCRQWGVPCRTAHALFPHALKPDAGSLNASLGLSSNPAEWPLIRSRQWHAQNGPHNSTPTGGSGLLASLLAGPAPRRPRVTAAAGPKMAVHGPALSDGVVDLTGDTSDSDEQKQVGKRRKAPDTKPQSRSKKRNARLVTDGDDDDGGGGAAAAGESLRPKSGLGSADFEAHYGDAARAPPLVTGRGDAELEAHLQQAMQMSMADAGRPIHNSRHDLETTIADAKVAAKKVKGAPAAAKGGAGASRAWHIGDAAWSKARGQVRHWVEVYVGGVPPHGTWVALFPWERTGTTVAASSIVASGALGTAPLVDITPVAEVSASAHTKQPLAYVVAAAGGGCRDVTRRYARQWSACQAVRTHEPWWTETLTRLSALEAGATASAVDAIAPSQGVGAAVVQREDADLQAVVLREPLPKKVGDYKSHPLYALERHLTRYQAIWPRDAVGSFNGEDVFPRSAVQELHTKDVWQRQYSRQVLDEQLATPAKVVLRRGVAAAQAKRAKEKKNGGESGPRGWGGNTGLGFDVAPVGTAFDDDPDDYDAAGAGILMEPGVDEDGDEEGGGGAAAKDADGGEEDPKTILYGLWQTMQYLPPGARGGIVPRSAYGNVDLCRGNAVPPGCVHLKGYPRISVLAARLGIDAVPALTGFDRVPGSKRMAPKLEGVVVAQENEQALVSAWLQEEEQRNEKQTAKRKAEALKRWRLLVRTYAEKQRLAGEQGDGGLSSPAADVIHLDSDGEDITPAPDRAPAAAKEHQLPVQRGGATAEVERM